MKRQAASAYAPLLLRAACLTVGLTWLSCSVARAPDDPFAAHVSRADPRTPEEERKGFHLPPGFEWQQADENTHVLMWHEERRVVAHVVRPRRSMWHVPERSLRPFSPHPALPSRAEYNTASALMGNVHRM